VQVSVERFLRPPELESEHFTTSLAGGLEDWPAVLVTVSVTV
jgi:hypothetical protein